jgi:hypothetical protein
VINLAAAGSLALTGDREVAHGLAGHLAASLRRDPYRDQVTVICTGVDLPPGDDRSATTGGDSPELLERMIASHERSPAERSVETGRTTVVVVAGASSSAPWMRAVVRRAWPGAGVVVIVVTDSPLECREEIRCGPDRALWVATGIVFEPTVVHSEPVRCQVPHLSGVTAARRFDMSAMIAGGDVLMLADAYGYDVVVQVLGEVTVAGATARFTGAEVELLALLATRRRRGPVNVDRLATLVAMDDWRTPAVRTVQARLSRLRGKLGADRDGQLMIPHADPGPNSPARYSVSPRVGTDLDLVNAAVTASFTQPPVEAAKTAAFAALLVRGVPFTARRGYAWADHDRDSRQAIDDLGQRLAALGETLDRRDLRERARAVVAIGLDDP